MKKYIKAADGSFVSFAKKAKTTFNPVTAACGGKKTVKGNEEVRECPRCHRLLKNDEDVCPECNEPGKTTDKASWEKKYGKIEHDDIKGSKKILAGHDDFITDDAIAHAYAQAHADDDNSSDDDDDILYLEEGVMQLVEDVLQSDYGLWSEPSTQNGIGSDFIYDINTDRCVGTIDYQDELNYAREALAANNDDFEAAAREIAEWIVSMIG